MNIIDWVSIAVLLVVIAVLTTVGQAQQRTEWTYKRCNSNDCIASTLNSLTPDRQHDAKLTTWRDVTDVWYRK